MNVLIACKHSNRETAKKIHSSLLKKENLRLDNYAVETFPIADAMIRFLFSLSSKFDLILMPMANNTRGYFWISKELKVQQLMGNCLNIYPVFAMKADVPSWWNEREPTFLIMKNIEADLNRVLSL